MLPRVVVLSALLAICHSFLLPNFYLGRRKTSPIITNKDTGFGATAQKFTQKLDHFSDNPTTWKQRYFVNLNFPRGTKAAFLNLGGRAPETITRVSDINLPWMKWASQYDAAVFNLEHRFYGESQPTNNQSVANLKYLTSKQALADAVEFINQMNQLYDLTNARWIVFGGSYGGLLALWLRQQYPNIVNGAVGSSAPLQITADFYQYMTVVEEALADNSTGQGGSPKCVDKVKIAFQSLISNMNTETGRAIISNQFNLIPKFDEFKEITYNDVQFFYYNMLQNFQEAVLYSGVNWGPYATGYGIKDICEKMEAADPLDPLDGLKQVNKYMKTITVQNDTLFMGTFNNFTKKIEDLQIEDFSAPDIPDFDSAERTWLWQTCTEFGFYPTTDINEKTIFGAVTPFSLYASICQKVFGDEYTASSIVAAVDATNAYYGGANGYRGTNVVLPNGSLDPYHVLGKTTSTDLSVVYYLIPGTTHMADMAPIGDPANTALTTVHNIIQKNLDKWIRGPVKNDSAPVVTTPGYLAISQANTRTKRSVLTLLPPKLSSIAQTKPAGASAFKKYHFGRPPGGFNPSLAATTTNINSFLGGINQYVDHFNNTNYDTFTQRYWKNDQWAKKNGPQFLIIGGEREEDPAWINNPNYTWLTYARAQGATVFLLEHRYYGESKIGFVNNTPQFLSSRQALYDVKNFIEMANVMHAYTQPWIVFGGSYAGALALWARQLFPNLIAGAIGSSGPLQAKLDFFEYLEVTQNSIRSVGTQNCTDNIAAGFKEMQRLLFNNGTGGIEVLNNLFNIDPPFDKNGNNSEQLKQYFFSNVYGNFQASVQYSGDNKFGYDNETTGHGIPFMCSIMTNTTLSPIKNVARFNLAMNQFYEKDSTLNKTDNNYIEFVNYLKSGGKTNEDAAMKYWTYQTCTEFGYFQSTDMGDSIFGSPTPVNFFIQMCKDTFPDLFPDEISAGDIIYKSVQETNAFYGGKDNYRGTNVVIPNGMLDPWSALGKTKNDSNSTSVTILLIDGVTHCADMYPARSSDPPQLTNARTIMGNFVNAWSTGSPAPTVPDTNGNTKSTTPSSNTNQTTVKPKSVRSAFTLLPVVISFLLL